MEEKDTRFITMLCNRIRSGKFAWENYQNGGTYSGREIQTQRMVCSYGMCGYDIWFPNQDLPRIQWDWELKDLTVDDLDYKTWLYWNEHYMGFWNEWIEDEETDLDFAPYVKAKHGIKVPNFVAMNW